jgi:hypothetical protein
MRTILLSFLLFTSIFLFSQQSYKKGYFVNNKGDTIRGTIQEDVEEKLIHSINFKDETGLLKTLSIADIKEFGFEEGGDFRVVNYVDPLDSLKSKTHFAKLLMQGTYQLFSFRRKDDLNFILVDKDTSYLLYDDIKSEFGDIFEKGNYQSLLSFFSRGCPKVSSTAASVNFSEESLIKFFVSLEKCTGNVKTTVVHYSKSEAQKNIMLFAGGMQLDDRSEISIQVLGQFVIPAVSRKSSLLAGIVYLRSTHESTQTYTLVKDQSEYETQIIEIPLLVRYEFFQKLVQPYVYGGVGIGIKKDKQTTTRTSLISANTEATGTTENSDFSGAVICGAGLNFRVAKNFLIGVDWRYDLASHLPVAGLTYKIRLGK